MSVACSTPVLEAGSVANLTLVATDGTLGLGVATFDHSVMTYPSTGAPYSVLVHAHVSGISVILGAGAALDTMVLTGTGFSSTLGNNVVMINDKPCNVTASNSTLINCTFSDAAMSTTVAMVQSYQGGRGLLLQVRCRARAPWWRLCSVLNRPGVAPLLTAVTGNVTQ